MAKALALLLLVLLALPAFPAADAATRCDYDTRTATSIGTGFVLTQSSRCSYDCGVAVCTLRVERVDYHSYDPTAPGGVRYLAGVVVESLRTQFPEGRETLQHQASLVLDDVSARATYADSRAPSGLTTCAASGGATRGGASYNVGGVFMPACWPRGFLLP